MHARLDSALYMISCAKSVTMYALAMSVKPSDPGNEDDFRNDAWPDNVSGYTDGWFAEAVSYVQHEQ
jgi:hypothetical protein